MPTEQKRVKQSLSLANILVLFFIIDSFFLVIFLINLVDIERQASNLESTWLGSMLASPKIWFGDLMVASTVKGFHRCDGRAFIFAI